jgi:hypothetical protein
MSTQASFALRGRNPDVLTCIANLSNDDGQAGRETAATRRHRLFYFLANAREVP